MRNEKSTNIDTMSTKNILTLINDEDMSVANRIQDVLPEIEKTVDVVCESLKSGGRLFYVGAGHKWTTWNS